MAQRVQTQAILKTNDMLLQYKLQEKAEREREERHERPNFFPFTHGDLIESQRKVLCQLQQLDVLKTIHLNSAKKLDQRAQKQAMLNQQANATLVALPPLAKGDSPNADLFNRLPVTSCIDKALERYYSDLTKLED